MMWTSGCVVVEANMSAMGPIVGGKGGLENSWLFVSFPCNDDDV